MNVFPSSEPEPRFEPKPEKVPDLTQDFPSLNGGAVGGTSSNINNNATGQAKLDSLAKKLAISSGRNVQSSWTTRTNGPSLKQLEEDFPSLPGTKRPDPTLAKASNVVPKSFQETSIKLKKGGGGAGGSKPPSGSDFPELPNSNNSNLHSFGLASTRNPSGAWSSQSKDVNNGAVSGNR